MPLQIRTAQADDYPAISAIHNAQTEPDHKLTADRLKRTDEKSASLDPTYCRLVALENNQIVGTSYFRNSWAGQREAGKYWTGIHVREDYRQEGVDSKLLHESVKRAVDSVHEVWTCLRQDFLPAAPFIAREAFVERFRSWGAHLGLTSFQPARFQPLIQRLQNEGIRLPTYHELTEVPDLDQRLQLLQRELEEDVLAFEPIIPRRHDDIAGPKTIPESIVIAIDSENHFIGIASLVGKAGQEALGCGLTGVVRPHRNRGIATALKARTAEIAKRIGCKDLNAGGGGSDTPMLTVNQKLGFEIEPAWITLAKQL